jgi:hypothetical protein
MWQLAGILVLAGGVVLGVVYDSWCPASAVLLIGILMVANQLGGVTRVRVTFSKLLVENERPVMGFLIGPAKQRIAWEELQAVEVQADRVVAKGKSTTLELGKGSPPAELAELKRRIEDAAERFKAESAPL